MLRQASGMPITNYLGWLNDNVSVDNVTWMENEPVGCSGTGPSMLIDYVAVGSLDDDVNFLVSACQDLHCMSVL